jgi:hypothetical protein
MVAAYEEKPCLRSNKKDPRPVKQQEDLKGCQRKIGIGILSLLPREVQRVMSSIWMVLMVTVRQMSLRCSYRESSERNSGGG